MSAPERGPAAEVSAGVRSEPDIRQVHGLLVERASLERKRLEIRDQVAELERRMAEIVREIAAVEVKMGAPLSRIAESLAPRRLP